jgi:hypothetical protein
MFSTFLCIPIEINPYERDLKLPHIKKGIRSWSQIVF